jgi:3-oxoacyl-[acyl-carrier-protein] synthase II
MTAVVVTGAGLVCPAASNAAELLAAGPDQAEPGSGRAEPGPEWFDPVAHLGRRGWKYLTPATRYLLAAAALTLADAQLDPARLPGDSMGVAVGTNFAAQPVVGRLDEVVRAEGAQWLSPAEAPNFSVNIAASHISMKYGMRAFNLTLTDPVVAGLTAVLTLCSAIRRGRATLGLAGATEERPADGPTGEGACCLAVESVAQAQTRGVPARAEVVGGFSRFLPAGVDPAVLGRPLDALLSDVDGPLPYAVVGDGELGWRVAELVTTRAGGPLLHRRYLGADGGYATTSPLLQVAGVLAEHGAGLVVATSPHGHVAAVRLRKRS